MPDLLLCFYPDEADSRALFPPSPLSIIVAVLVSPPHPSSPLPVPVSAAVLCSFSRLRPRFPSRPRPHHRFRPRPRSRCRPRLLLPVPRTWFFSPLGTKRLKRHRALLMELLGARKRHPLSAEMVTRAG